MPPIFKALATISAWILFILGCFAIVANLVGGTLIGEYFNPDAGPSVSTVLAGALGVACLILSVCAMKLRQLLE